MIDRQGQQAAAVLARPASRQPQQGDGIAAARQGQGDRAFDIGFQTRGQRGPGGAGPVSGDWRQPGLRAGAAGAAQPMRVRASVARVRTAALAPSA